jgi:hypothetical protein
MEVPTTSIASGPSFRSAAGTTACKFLNCFGVAGTARPLGTP